MCTRARKLVSFNICLNTRGVLYLCVRELRVYLRFGFVWECLQVIVVISTVIVKIYSIVSSGHRHIAEPRKFLVSYYLLSLSSLTLCKQIYFTQRAQHYQKVKSKAAHTNIGKILVLISQNYSTGTSFLKWGYYMI